jgi:hypothetical protein
MKRVLIILLALVSISWTVFVGVELLGLDTKEDFTAFFNEEDERILVIHNHKEMDWQKENFGILPSNQSLVVSLFPRLQHSSVYISAKRSLILIKQRENWDASTVNTLLKNGVFKFQKGQFKRFQFGDYNGKYAGNMLLLWKGELVNSKSLPDVDKKASYSFIRFGDDGAFVEDIYQKLDKTYKYTSFQGKNKVKDLQDDAAFFAGVIPTNFVSYTYFSNEFARFSDSIYKAASLSKCNEKGFVLLSDGRDSLIVFPFIEGLHPIQVINEEKGIPEMNQSSAKFSNLALTHFLKVKEDAFIYVTEIGNIALFSTSSAYLEAIATEIRLHKSLSQHPEKMKSIFGYLPKKVFYRRVDSKVQQSIAFIGKKWLQTDLKKKDVYIPEKQEKINDYFAMNPGERITYFTATSGRGNVILSTETNRLIGYVNGSLKWEKKYSQPIVNMGVFNEENNLTCLIVEGEAQVYDQNGRIIYRFAVNHHVLPLLYNAPDGKVFLPVATAPNNLLIFTTKGGIHKQIKTKSVFSESFLFKFQGKDYVGARTSNQLLYTDFVRKSKVLEFALDSTAKKVVFSGEPVFLLPETNGVSLLRLTGQRTLLKTNGLQSYAVSNENGTDYLWIGVGNTLYKFDSNGKKKWEKSLDLTEISALQVFQNQQGKVVLGILDGLQNRIYLFDLNGVNIDVDNRHGERAFQMSAFGSSAFSITTFLGTNLIQYNKL